jgi:hypothetical protein
MCSVGAHDRFPFQLLVSQVTEPSVSVFNCFSARQERVQSLVSTPQTRDTFHKRKALLLLFVLDWTNVIYFE